MNDLIITYTDNGKNFYIRTSANLPAGAPLRAVGYWLVNDFEAYHLTDAGPVRLNIRLNPDGRIYVDVGYREAVRQAGGQWFPPCARASD